MVTKKMTVASIAEIISWSLQNMGYLTKEGFVVKPTMEGKLLGECIVLNDQMLDELEKELDSQ